MQPELRIDNITPDDLKELEKWVDEIALPDFDDPFVVVRGGVFNGSDVLYGAGFIKLIGEATISLNPALTLRQKMEVLRLLFAEGKIRSHNLGIDILTAFTPDKLYVRLLKKRFGFDDSSGIGLRLRL
jgi:hypothetical protein